MHDGGEAIVTSLCCGLRFFVVWAYLFINQCNFYWRRVPKLLERRLEEEDCRLLHKEQRYLRTGTFFWRTGNSVVYRIQAEGPAGDRKDGWVCLGSGFWFTSDYVSIEWDRPRNPPRPPPVSDDQLPTRGNPLMWDRELDD